MMNCTCHKKLCGEYLPNGKCLIYQCYEVLIREMIREKEMSKLTQYPFDAELPGQNNEVQSSGYRMCVFCQRMRRCIDLFGEVVCPDCAMRIFPGVNDHGQF
jgi:hypothetical protein